MPFFATKSPKTIKLTPIQNNVLSGYLLQILLFPGKVFCEYCNLIYCFSAGTFACCSIPYEKILVKYWNPLLTGFDRNIFASLFLSPKESTCETRKIVFIFLQKLFPFSRLSNFRRSILFISLFYLIRYLQSIKIIVHRLIYID